MGAWGTAILADDFACDLRAAYLARLADGEPPAAATRALIKAYGKLDADEGPIFWLALAATQWEYGALDPEVKRRALAIITTGRDAGTWLEGGPDRRRTAALAALGKKLRRRPPPVKRPRRAKPVATPSQPPVPSPDGSAIATAFAIGTLAQVMIEIPRLGGGGGVFAADCALADIRLRWRGNATLEISHPAKARVEEPIDAPDRFYLSGRTIALKFVKRKG